MCNSYTTPKIYDYKCHENQETHYNSVEEFANRTKLGEEGEDFGGLSLFLDLKRVGFVLQPEEIGCINPK